MATPIFKDLNFSGFAPYYDANGRLVGHFVVMEYINIFNYGFFRKDNGKFVFEKEHVMTMPTKEGPNGIKYIFEYQTSMGDIYYVGEVMKNIVVSI